jgi:hypothetical protein
MGLGEPRPTILGRVNYCYSVVPTCSASVASVATLAALYRFAGPGIPIRRQRVT